MDIYEQQQQQRDDLIPTTTSGRSTPNRLNNKTPQLLTTNIDDYLFDGSDLFLFNKQQQSTQQHQHQLQLLNNEIQNRLMFS